MQRFLVGKGSAGRCLRLIEGQYETYTQSLNSGSAFVCSVFSFIHECRWFADRRHWVDNCSLCFRHHDAFFDEYDPKDKRSPLALASHEGLTKIASPGKVWPSAGVVYA